MSESFFAALKNEPIYRSAFPTRKVPVVLFDEYIEVFYNPIRLHPDSATEHPTKSPPSTTRNN